MKSILLSPEDIHQADSYHLISAIFYLRCTSEKKKQLMLVRRNN